MLLEGMGGSGLMCVHIVKCQTYIFCDVAYKQRVCFSFNGLFKLV